MGLIKNDPQILKYTYDFAKDGGAVGAITLGADILGVEEDFIIQGISVFTEVAVTSGGSPSVTLGNTSDPDGYFADMIAAGIASVGGVINEGALAGALIWDDTNDHNIEFRITSAADTQDLLLTVGTAALTAGKLVIAIRGYKPGAV